LLERGKETLNHDGGEEKKEGSRGRGELGNSRKWGWFFYGVWEEKELGKWMAFLGGNQKWEGIGEGKVQETKKMKEEKRGEESPKGNELKLLVGKKTNSLEKEKRRAFSRETVDEDPVP